MKLGHFTVVIERVKIRRSDAAEQDGDRVEIERESGVIAQTKENKNWAGVYAFTGAAQKSKRLNPYDVAPMIEYKITV